MPGELREQPHRLLLVESIDETAEQKLTEIDPCLPGSTEEDIEVTREKRFQNLELQQVVPNGSQPVNASTNSLENAIPSSVVYRVNDVPPWHLCLIFGLQHYLTMFGGTISYPYILTPKLCMRQDDPARGFIISTTFFVSGIVTFLQATFGVRLPIIQGSTFSFLIPTLAILSLPQWQCPSEEQIIASRPMTFNDTNSTIPVTEAEWRNLWVSRILEIQGAVIVASLFEVLIGFTGLVGYFMKWIGPIGVTPVIMLIGISLFEDASRSAATNWGIAFMTILLLILFSEYLKEFKVPLILCSRKKGIRLGRFPLFKLFPVLLTIIISWVLCIILTVTNVFPEGNPARTDIKLAALESSPWFRVPYPGQWGMPTVSAGAVFGIMAGVLSSTIESVGDYYACARMSGAPPPPTHAVNRGICFEGIGCVLAGIFGSGNGLTSYSENIGAIGVTKVGSRRVIQYGGLLMIFFGSLGKFGALFVTMPEPVVGGIFCVMFAVITGVALSNLQFINLNSSRNLFILGCAIFFGLMIPKFIKTNPEFLDTGSIIFDQILNVLLTTSLFVGGIIGIFMDNTVPGTDAERGIVKWREQASSSSTAGNEKIRVWINACYDLPFGMEFIKRHSFFKYMPISPTYDPDLVARKFKSLLPCCKNNEQTETRSTKV